MPPADAPVGGIHTVIRTKVPETVRHLGDDYCLIGPLADLAKTEVEEQKPPPVSAAMQPLPSARATGKVPVRSRGCIRRSVAAAGHCS